VVNVSYGWTSEEGKLDKVGWKFKEGRLVEEGWAFGEGRLDRFNV